jgi:hypothetical protein
MLYVVICAPLFLGYSANTAEAGLYAVYAPCLSATNAGERESLGRVRKLAMSVKNVSSWTVKRALKKAVMISQERKHVFNATVYSRA